LYDTLYALFYDINESLMKGGGNMSGFISVDPKICSGKPVLKGTRIMVKNILGMVAGGYNVDRILDAYPELTREMVQNALEYAAEVIDEEQVIAHA
jgi:uncharacterized protein (DUF433 family)